jgi:hypothetical protein
MRAARQCALPLEARLDEWDALPRGGFAFDFVSTGGDGAILLGVEGGVLPQELREGSSRA